MCPSNLNKLELFDISSFFACSKIIWYLFLCTKFPKQSFLNLIYHLNNVFDWNCYPTRPNTNLFREKKERDTICNTVEAQNTIIIRCISPTIICDWWFNLFCKNHVHIEALIGPISESNVSILFQLTRTHFVSFSDPRAHFRASIECYWSNTS